MKSLVQINKEPGSTFDNTRRPFDQDEIMERLMSVMTQRATSVASRCYNVIFTNCKHFTM